MFDNRFVSDSKGSAMKCFLALIPAVMLTASPFVQAQDASTAGNKDKPARLAFEVTSIKPFKPPIGGGPIQGGIKAMPGGQEYQARGVPVMLMISLMYKVPPNQLTGGPDWLTTDRWDVDAKADRPGYNIDDLHTMYQNLLADEFKLKFHSETRQGNVYALLLDKSGSKMKVNEKPEDFEIPIKGGGPNGVSGTRVPMKYLAWWLGQQLQRTDGRPVIDRTQLTGFYDFNLMFRPELPPGVPTDQIPPEIMDRPTIFEALRAQLGLRLEQQKGPVEYLVIDHAEKPAEN
jgi:uncharacterized protein (TIGR03435 family)